WRSRSARFARVQENAAVLDHLPVRAELLVPRGAPVPALSGQRRAGLPPPVLQQRDTYPPRSTPALRCHLPPPESLGVRSVRPPLRQTRNVARVSGDKTTPDDVRWLGQRAP